MSFNIDKIIKGYPRAWWDFIQWLINNSRWQSHWAIADISFQDGFIWISSHKIHFRELYDFFDSVGVRVEALYSNPYSSWYGIVNGKSDFHNDTRTEAEYRAFEKAFEIRENKLRQHTDGINSNTVS